MLHNSQHMLHNQQHMLRNHQHMLHNQQHMLRNLQHMLHNHEKVIKANLFILFESSTSLAISEDTFLLLGVSLNHSLLPSSASTSTPTLMEDEMAIFSFNPTPRPPGQVRDSNFYSNSNFSWG